LGSFALGNNFYRSKFGTSFNKDIRGIRRRPTTVSVSERYTLAFGVAYSREESEEYFHHRSELAHISAAAGIKEGSTSRTASLGKRLT